MKENVREKNKRQKCLLYCCIENRNKHLIQPLTFRRTQKIACSEAKKTEKGKHRSENNNSLFRTFANDVL